MASEELLEGLPSEKPLEVGYPVMNVSRKMLFAKQTSRFTIRIGHKLKKN